MTFVVTNTLETVTVDGSYGEGGGQILRTSLSLSAITGRPLVINNIRAGREKPGLQPQHLAAVRAAAAICDAEVEGDAVGSTRIVFIPRASIRSGEYRFEIGTAGATALVAQTLLLPLALADLPSRLTITGGTHVPHAPPAEYIEKVYLPILRQVGIAGDMRSTKAGYYPKGGGEIVLSIEPSATIHPISLPERGKLKTLISFVITSGLPAHVAERGAATVDHHIKKMGMSVTIERRDIPSPSPGAAVILVATCAPGIGGFTAFGKRGKPMERVAEEACRDFARWWKTGAACDEHIADQLVLPMAFASGESRWTTPVITEHLRTVLFVVQQFLPIESSAGMLANGTTAVSLRERP